MTEFDDVIRLLEEGRPQATAMELDEIKQRVRRRAAEPSRRSQSMKSRLAILSMLVAGMVFSTAGAGLAVQGLNSTDASVAEYESPTPVATVVATVVASPTPEGSVLPAEETHKAHKPASGSAPAAATSTPAPTGGVEAAEESSLQPASQAAGATSSQLPFTGFAAIPVLLGGIALLSLGLVLRRRTRPQR